MSTDNERLQDERPDEVPDEQKVTGGTSGTPGSNTMSGVGTSGTGTIAGGDTGADNPENTAREIEKAHEE